MGFVCGVEEMKGSAVECSKRSRMKIWEIENEDKFEM